MIMSVFERGFRKALALWASGMTLESITHAEGYDASAYGRGMFAAVEALNGWLDVASREAKAHGLNERETQELIDAARAA